MRTTHGGRRTVFETLLHLRLAERAIELQVAVVGERVAGGRLQAIRVYHSLWPPDPALRLTDIIAEYQHALAAGDAEAIVRAFEPESYFREPAGANTSTGVLNSCTSS